MSGIPIVVSRLTNSGKKEVYTVRDPITNHDDYVRQLAQSPPPDFFTMDYHKEKENKVRIRRIQSSGSRRNFPKDFFSREGQRPNRNITLKEKQENKNLQVGLNTIVKKVHEFELEQPKIDNETPKFREKIPGSKVNLLSKNQTFRQAFKKIIPQKENLIEEEKKVDKKLNPFENTFSGNNIGGMFWKDPVLNIKSSKIEKENLPTKKIKVSKEFLAKKFSLMKDKSNFWKEKKLKI